jgi:hypothetical protein
MNGKMFCFVSLTNECAIRFVVVKQASDVVLRVRNVKKAFGEKVLFHFVHILPRLSLAISVVNSMTLFRERKSFFDLIRPTSTAQKVALAGVSLDICKGEIFALLGISNPIRGNFRSFVCSSFAFRKFR